MITIAQSIASPKGQSDYNTSTRWRELGSITVEQALLGATEKDHASVLVLPDGAGLLHMVEDGSIAYEWRFRTDGDEDDAPVLQLYRCSGVDHFSHVAQLALVQGTQRASVGYFADGVTPTKEAWFDDTFSVQPTVKSNNIASYGLNVFGNNQFLFIASSLVVTTIYIDARRLP